MSNKKLVRDILISIPIGVLYIYFINKINEIIVNDLEYNEKIKKSIMVFFVSVIVSLVLAFKVFGNGKTYNRIIKYALIFASVVIFTNAILYNWPELQTDSKAIIVGLALLLSILITYKLA
jgi:hypothetical protein